MSDKPNNDELISNLFKDYKNAHAWVTDAILAREGKGTGAALNAMRCLREEISAWENNGVTVRDNRVTFDIPGLDFSEYEKEKSANV